MSHPLRMCGLKCLVGCPLCSTLAVTSLTDVWIEIKKKSKVYDDNYVTSLTDVWIEIKLGSENKNGTVVTSLTDVWIEIS